MSANRLLDNSIRRLRRRVRALLVERYALFGAGAGALAAAVVVLLSYRYDDLLDYRLWAAVVLAGALAGCAYGLLRKLDDFTVAAAADRRTGLKERLSSAVSFGESHDSDDMIRALVSDANKRIAGRSSRQVFPHRFGAAHIASGAAFLMFLGVIFVPQLPGFQPGSRRQEVAVMKKEGQKIAKLADEIKKHADPKHRDLRDLADRLRKLGWKMQTGRLAKKQAMLKMQRLNKHIRKEQDKLARENSKKKSMDQAVAQMRKASAELARRMAEKMAEEENIPPEEALKKVPSDKRLADLARKEEPLTEVERRELEQAIEKYADPGSRLGIPPELGEALAKLAASGDYQRAMELMRQLSEKLDLGNMSPTDSESLRKVLEQLAKALKDTDLDKLAKQMLENAEKLSKMTPEELKELAEQMKRMQQLAKALENAGAG